MLLPFSKCISCRTVNNWPIQIRLHKTLKLLLLFLKSSCLNSVNVFIRFYFTANISFFVMVLANKLSDYRMREAGTETYF